MTAALAAGAAEFEHVRCVQCGADRTDPVLHGRDVRRRVPGELTVVRCRRCRLAYVNPRPTQRSIVAYYPPDYLPHKISPPTRLDRWYYRLFRRLPCAPAARVLDVGCGGGKYVGFLRDRGYVVAGLDVNRELATAVRERLGIEVYAGEIHAAAIPTASFDVVTLWWVLEHTHDPVRVLREAHRILRPGGHLVASVQNFASLARRLFGSDWHHLDLPGHLYHFEPQTLSAMLELSGFETIRLRQDLFTKDLAPSLGYRLGLNRSLDRPVPNLLALPFELAAWALRLSGLITAYAVRR